MITKLPDHAAQTPKGEVCLILRKLRALLPDKRLSIGMEVLEHFSMLFKVAIAVFDVAYAGFA